MDNGTVLTIPQVFELNAAVSRQLPRDISGADAQYWIGHQEELSQVLQNGLIRQQPETPEKVAPKIVFSGRPLADLGQMGFYSEMWKYLNWELNTEGLYIPAYQDGFNWLITSPLGLMSNKAYEFCEKHFPCWRYTDNLDQAIVHNDRDAKNGAYVIRARDIIEADEKYRNWSANKLWKRQVACITLTERLVLELAVFLISGRHLDIDNWTLCAGSRLAAGGVPSAGWNDGQFEVSWFSPGNAFDNLRARQVVS